MWGADGAAPAFLLKWQVLPLPSADQWSESQALGGSYFLLKVFAIASFHSAGNCPVSLLCLLVEEFLDVWSQKCRFHELGTCYLSPSQSPCCYIPPAATCRSWAGVSVTQEKGFGTGYPTRPSQQDGGHSSEIKVAVPLGGFALCILAVADVSTQTCWRKKLKVRPQTAEVPLTCADGHRMVPSYWGVCTSDVSHCTWTWNVPPSKRFPLVQTAMWTSLADVPHSLSTLVMVLLVSPGVLQGCRSERQPPSLLAPQLDSFSFASCHSWQVLALP